MNEDRRKIREFPWAGDSKDPKVCEVVSEFARVRKPFTRHRVTVTGTKVNPDKPDLTPYYADTYVVAPSAEEATKHVLKALGLKADDFHLSALTLED